MINRDFAFEYIAKDEQLLRFPAIVYVDLREIQVLGSVNRTVLKWDKNFYNMYGFFIISEGVEYGSVSVNASQFRAAYNSCCTPPIHVLQFDDPFM